MSTREPTPRIELAAGRGYFRWVCDVCGEMQGKDGMLSRVVFDSSEGPLSYDICRACLEAGAEGAVDRSTKHAEYLEQLAKLHRESIPNALRMVSEWPTGKDYDAVRDAFEKENAQELKLDTPHGELSVTILSDDGGDEFPF